MLARLLLLSGPSLPGRWLLARSLEERLDARRFAGCTAAHATSLARALAGARVVVADGELATPAERHAILAATFAADQLLVEWRCDAAAAERECFHRYASRPRALGLDEWHRYLADSERRIAVDNEELPGRVLRIDCALPVDRVLLRVVELLRAPSIEPAQTWPRRVLVVEDDAEERGLMADVLRELGYAVTLAPDAGVALALLDDGLHIELVLSDQEMPGMTGVELAAILRSRHPRIRTVLMSAFADEELCHEALAADAVTLLGKPLRVVDLARVLDEAIACSRASAP